MFSFWRAMSSTRRKTATLALSLVAIAGLLMVGACAGAGPGYMVVNGTVMPIPSSAGTPGGADPLAVWVASGQTQEVVARTQAVAAGELTAAADYRTRVAQETLSAVGLTQTQISMQMAADEATLRANGTNTAVANTAVAAASTLARAQTQDQWTAAAATSTQQQAYARDTAEAAATETRQAQVDAENTAAANTQEAKARADARATEVQATVDAQTQQVRTWGPYVLFVVVLVVALVVLFRWLRVKEIQNRVIQQPDGTAFYLAEQRPALAPLLPNFLRWLAWFLETNQVVVDPKRSAGPALQLAGGEVTAPLLTDTHDRQERVTKRAQTVEAVRAYAQGSGRDGPDEAGALVPMQGGGLPPQQEVVEGEYQIVDPQQYRQWLEEVRQHLLPGDGATAPPGE